MLTDTILRLPVLRTSARSATKRPSPSGKRARAGFQTGWSRDQLRDFEIGALDFDAGGDRMHGKTREQRILVLCKTYPSPSAKYVETSCVAGMDEQGHLIRLYPVPFRYVSDDQQFKKYQWITAKVQKANNDHRPESHRIFTDTIHCDPVLDTENHWEKRRQWLDRLPVFDDFDALEAARQSTGMTLALLRPSRIAALEITPAASDDWTPDELDCLLQAQKQGQLFEDTERKDLARLKKLPFEFHYRYVCESAAGVKAYRHKIVDWEAGALYGNVRRTHLDQWEAPFRQQIEGRLPQQDLMFLMGTIHRFKNQWLIVSLIYPPKQRPEPKRQGSLF